MASDELGRKAADEIERLTESNAIWQEIAKEVTDAAGVNTLIHVPAEIERLQKVLEAIAACEGMTLLGCAPGSYMDIASKDEQRAHEYGANKAFNQCASMAKQALAEGEVGDEEAD
jgi:hypothetical protein